MTILARIANRSSQRSTTGAAGHRWGHRLASASRLAADLIFPPRCILCGGAHSQESIPLCTRCLESLKQARSQPACPRCASDVAPHEVSDGRCAICRHRRPRTLAIARVGAYQQTLARLTRLYKYHARTHLGQAIGGWLADSIAATPWHGQVEGIVAVPTLRRRKLLRPHYPAEDLAGIVGTRLGWPVLPLLRRIRGGRHQIGLSYEDRRRNVRGAFAMRRGVSMNHARLLLLDDVKTTGATLNECAKVLRQAGAAEVYAAVVLAVHWDRDADLAPPAV